MKVAQSTQRMSRNGHAVAGHLRPSDIGRLSEVYPVGTVKTAQHLIGAGSSAMIVDYERDGSVGGTWFSPDLHYFDMSLGRRSKDACGRFVEASRNVSAIGSIFFAPAGYHFSARGGPGRQKTLSVVFESGSIGRCDEIDAAVAAQLPNCIDLRNESIRFLMKRIADEVETPGFASSLLLDGLCLALLVETARAPRGADHRALRKGGLSGRNLRLIEERVRLGDANPTLAELSSLCSLSARHLARAFRAETGGTISDYVQNVRFEQSRHLLSATALPIAEIARRAGFSSASAFSTAFRRLCGRSPRDYRLHEQASGRER